jgi:hypothetical protein
MNNMFENKLILEGNIIYFITESIQTRANRLCVKEGEMISDDMYAFKFISENMFFAKAVVIGVDMKPYYIPTKVNGQIETYSFEGTMQLDGKKNFRILCDAENIVSLDESMLSTISDENQEKFIEMNK